MIFITGTSDFNIIKMQGFNVRLAIGHFYLIRGSDSISSTGPIETFPECIFITIL